MDANGFQAIWAWLNTQAASVLNFLNSIKDDPIVVLMMPVAAIVGATIGATIAYRLRQKWQTLLLNRYKPELAKDSIRLMPDKHRDNVRGIEARGIESFQYSRRQDDFLGRQPLIDKLVTEFIDIKGTFSEDKAFRWTLIYGRAGSGKSRFALELLRALEQKYGKHYAICGFVERDSSDTANALNVTKIENWPFRKPALFVLDYAGTNRELVAIIKALQLKARQIKQPLRLLLLERRNDSGGIADLNRVGDEDRFLQDTCFGLAGYHTGKIGIELEQLADQDIEEIMVSRILRERGYLGEGETPEWLTERLDDIDCGERRPLFAVMVASAIADQPVHQADYQMGMVERLEKRDAMLRYLIQRDRRKYWQQTNDKINNLSLGLHQNLLALATFARGLDMTVLNESDKYSGARIPNRETFEASRYSRMTTSNAQSQFPLGFLEPDFIGEWFVLNQLNPSAPIYPDEPANKPEFKCFVSLAWEKGRERAAQFIRQCHQNHPDTVQKLGYLLPDPGAFTNFVVLLLRDLLLDWRHSLSQVSESAQGQAIAEKIAERAQEVFELLQQHLAGVVDICDETKVNLADATDSYLYILCWLLSPTLRGLKDDRLEIIGEQSAIEKSRAPIHKSIKLQDIFRNETISEQFGRDGKAFPGLNSVAEASDIARQNIPEIAETLALLQDWQSARKPEKNVPAKVEANNVADPKTRENKDGVFIYKLAARLLTDAASFFRTLAEQNESLRGQMNENADVFNQISLLLEGDPRGYLEESQHCELAGRLLSDASQFFRSLAEQNEPIRQQMMENANVYEQLGRMVNEDPMATLD